MKAHACRGWFFFMFGERRRDLGVPPPPILGSTRVMSTQKPMNGAAGSQMERSTSCRCSPVSMVLTPLYPPAEELIGKEWRGSAAERMGRRTCRKTDIAQDYCDGVLSLVIPGCLIASRTQ